MSSTDIEEKVQPTDRANDRPRIWHYYCKICNGPQPFPVGSIAQCGFRKAAPGSPPGWRPPPVGYQACVVCDDLGPKCRRHP